ncbi:hypothetical protein VNO77_17451 [Canavalia gladiata]|uniref:Uncharacterized protein n=1 Tax=Canavalia gladiata TaxID=3824 RepID=A0AAN9LJ04_CANGL
MQVKVCEVGEGSKIQSSESSSEIGTKEVYLETVVLVLSQPMACQLQRLPRLVRDHELRERGRGWNRLFSHLTRASAFVLVDAVIFNGSKDIKNT